MRIELLVALLFLAAAPLLAAASNAPLGASALIDDDPLLYARIMNILGVGVSELGGSGSIAVQIRDNSVKSVPPKPPTPEVPKPSTSESSGSGSGSSATSNTVPSITQPAAERESTASAKDIPKDETSKSKSSKVVNAKISDGSGFSGIPLATQPIAQQEDNQGDSPEPLSITTDSLPDGAAGEEYSTTIHATGGTEPYSWSADGLPSSLTIDQSSGEISGTIDAVKDGGGIGGGKGEDSATDYSVSITVTDAQDEQASTNLNLHVTGSSGGLGGLGAALVDFKGATYAKLMNVLGIYVGSYKH